MKITRPKYVTAPLAAGVSWQAGTEWLDTEKKDGVWTVRECHNATLIGETMRNGDFWAFDCIRVGGDDLRGCALRDRWQALAEFAALGIKIVPRGHGGEFLRSILAAGGEGIVRARLDAPFGFGLWKCKRSETFDLVVAEKHSSKSSVRLCSREGEPFGWCPVRGRNFYQVSPGNLIEIEAYGRTVNGALREPRFVRLRWDGD